MNSIGRILFGLPMIGFGVLHFAMAGAMGGMVPPFIPGGVIWVYITGAGLLLAGIAIIADRMISLASLLLGILLLSFVLTIHIPAVAGGDQAAMSNLLKDIALAGGAFYIYAVATASGKGLMEM